MFTSEDIRRFESMGTTAEAIEAQLRRFATGFPVLKIEAVATVGNGIVKLSEKEENRCLQQWRAYDGTIEKFVPASGAASRMFKDLFAFLEGDHDQPETDFEKMEWYRLIARKK